MLNPHVYLLVYILFALCMCARRTAVNIHTNAATLPRRQKLIVHHLIHV